MPNSATETGPTRCGEALREQGSGGAALAAEQRTPSLVVVESVLPRLKREVFARHCHPCSAWSRWLTTPLVLVPVWHRSWRQGVLVAAWFAANPVVFGEPTSHDAFATKAMLGEQLWTDALRIDATLLVNALAGTAGVGALIAAWQRRSGPAAAATTAEMALLLLYWRQMATYYEQQQRVRSG